MTQGFTGWLFGDKGYLCKKLFLRLYRRGVKRVTGIKKTWKNILMNGHEKLLLRKRCLIEAVFDALKKRPSLSMQDILSHPCPHSYPFHSYLLPAQTYKIFHLFSFRSI